MPYKAATQDKSKARNTQELISGIKLEHREVSQDELDVESDGEVRSNDTHGDDGIRIDNEQKDLRDYQLARDRVRRKDVRPPSRYADSEMLNFALCVAEAIEFAEPENYKAAMECRDKDKWLKAMIEEIDSLLKNGTWVLVDKVDGSKIVSCKWIFKQKLESVDGEKIRYKARLVACGFTQEQGGDYNEAFSPVVKHTSI